MNSGCQPEKRPNTQYETTLASPAGRITSLSNSVERVEHFGGEDRAGQRGAEDRADARAHAGRHEHPPFRRAEPQQIAQERAKAGADLSDRPLAPAGTARAERNRTGDDLDERHAGPDLSLLVSDRRR